MAIHPITNGEWVVYFYWPEGKDYTPTVRAWNMHSGEVRDLGLSNWSEMMDLCIRQAHVALRLRNELPQYQTFSQVKPRHSGMSAPKKRWAI